MAHDPTKVLLGNVPSSVKEIDNRKGVIDAGLIVRLKSDDTISLLKADGSALGISVGRDMSGIGHTAIARKGLRIPIQLTASFVPVVGAQVNISDTTGKAGTAGAGLTAVNASYASGVLTGISEIDGSSIEVALIDMPGGL